MNKVVIAIAALVALALVGCASLPTAEEMMSDAKRNAPDGVIVAMATANSDNAATQEVKSQMIRALVSMTRNMSQDAMAAGEIPSAAVSGLVQPITIALSRTGFSGVQRLGTGVGKGGVHWTVVYMDKSVATRELNIALTAAKEVVPEAANFKIESRFDAEYASAANREWKNQ